MKRLRRYRHTHVTLQAGHWRTVGQSHLKRVHQRGEEQKQLHARQRIAEAHAPADAERHKEGGLLHFTLRIDEAPRIKVLGSVPQFRVHVDAVDQRNDVRTGRNGVALQLDVTVLLKNGVREEIGKKGDGGGVNQVSKPTHSR